MKTFKRTARVLLGLSTLPIIGAWACYFWLETLNCTHKCGTSYNHGK